MVWQPHLLPRVQGLNPRSSSSLDSFPLSHNNSAPIPAPHLHPRHRKGPAWFGAPRTWTPALARAPLPLEMLSSHMATSPLQSKGEKTRSQRRVGAALPQRPSGPLVTGKARGAGGEGGATGPSGQIPRAQRASCQPACPSRSAQETERSQDLGLCSSLACPQGRACPGRAACSAGAGGWGGTFSHPEQEACWHLLLPGGFRRKT